MWQKWAWAKVIVLVWPRGAWPWNKQSSEYRKVATRPSLRQGNLNCTSQKDNLNPAPRTDFKLISAWNSSATLHVAEVDSWCQSAMRLQGKNGSPSLWWNFPSQLPTISKKHTYTQVPLLTGNYEPWMEWVSERNPCFVVPEWPPNYDMRNLPASGLQIMYSQSLGIFWSSASGNSLQNIIFHALLIQVHAFTYMRYLSTQTNLFSEESTKLLQYIFLSNKCTSTSSILFAPIWIEETNSNEMH